MKVARAVLRQTVILLITIMIHHLIPITTLIATTVIFGDSIPKGINIKSEYST